MNVFHGLAISKFCTIYKEKIIFLLRYQHDSLLMKIFKIACFLFGITFNTTWYNVWCAWVLHSTEIKCAANAVKFLINICFRKTKNVPEVFDRGFLYRWKGSICTGG